MFPPKFPRILLVAVSVACFSVAIPCLADSQARIVRLSDVQGDVQIDRGQGQGYEKAFLNLPVTQGTAVRTGDTGKAELEFEDGSTLRMTPNSSIEVPALALRDSGAKASAVQLQAGVVYVNFLGAKGDQLDVAFAREKLTLNRPAHIRVSLADATAGVAVFKGEVAVAGPQTTLRITKDHSASFDLADDQYKVADNIESDPLDSWDKQQGKYQQLYANNSYSSYSPYAYGADDLNYYGSFFNLPGYGMLWQPYFTGAGWDPWMNGAWAFNPGLGYGWVSAYPWGWTPYHYGSWMYLPLYGWAWQPGGAWMGGNAYPVFLNPPIGFLGPQAPSDPGHHVVLVNRGSTSSLKGNKIAIGTNSAGLGIPRGSVANLSELSQRVNQKGTAMATVHSSPVARYGWSRGGVSESTGSGWRGSSPMSSSSMHTTSGGHSSGGVGHH
jgi:FecR protein